MAKAAGCEDPEPSFRPSNTEQRKLPHVSVISDTRGKFSVNSQAVPGFTTACQAAATGAAHHAAVPSRRVSAGVPNSRGISAIVVGIRNTFVMNASAIVTARSEPNHADGRYSETISTE